MPRRVVEGVFTKVHNEAHQNAERVAHQPLLQGELRTKHAEKITIREERPKDIGIRST